MEYNNDYSEGWDCDPTAIVAFVIEEDDAPECESDLIALFR